MAERKTWANWKFESDRGRSVWRFAPPGDLQGLDWTGALLPKQVSFLEEMSNDFIYDKKANPNSGDKVYRSATSIKPTPKRGLNAADAAHLGIEFYQSLQTKDGNWPGDYGGPMFLLPGLIIASYVTDSPFSAPETTLMKRYMLNHQNEDGGWGMHLEGKSTMFGTVLQYVSLRILGMTPTEEPALKARNWIQSNGGATDIPSWGKFYLSLLGVYEWEGCNCLFPEMWLLPKGLPVHPSRYWCHSRMVYLPMGYCYGHKVVKARTILTEQLRFELYTESYNSINWANARNKCADTDLYSPQSGILQAMNGLLNIYEKVHSKGIRAKALDFALDYINAEDQQTNYIDIGPVNQALNSICIWHAYGRDSEQFRRHRERWADYLWIAEDGMKMQGYNGSQFWDTVFTVQAVKEGGFENDFPELIAKGVDFIDKSQIRSEVPDREKFFRHMQIGGWPFSTLDHGWPITDCTAEGLKTTLIMAPETDPERLFQAVNVILSYQNEDGGCASYENTRGPKWLEQLNPAEVFGDIMIDHSYTECSSACLQAIMKFKKHYPDHRKQDVERFINRGIEFILSQQRSDGSWYGSWAVCFTYGTWFGVEALSQFMGLADDRWQVQGLRDRAKAGLEKAVQFLLSKQNPDGGWGESFESCVQKKYIPSPTSQVVNTSWALLSLMAAGYHDTSVLETGVSLIMSRQCGNGDWPQENISGVFNHNCMITYTSYRNVFPIWALGRYSKLHARS